MGHYLPSTEGQQKEMLKDIGLSSLEQLHAVAPEHLRLADGPDIPEGLSELEVSRVMRGMAGRNKVFHSIFRGAGAYRHYIPSVVKSIVSKETFLTAYTPYQAEISQGILQSIFEYQTMICDLTGMEVANASVYDGATAVAEAVSMCRDRKRTKALVSSAAPPDYIETVKTYSWAMGAEVVMIPEKDGATDLDALTDLLDGQVASVYLQQPNYYGILENCAEAAEKAHDAGAKFIMGINPVAAAILKTPGECGADIAVGEGQPLGMPLSFGGPYLGFMACTAALTRKLPGRIVGETVDAEGSRAFVLTLQAREQHIRREKASSNICSNQALCAMTAAVYMATMGPDGLRNAAAQCAAKAHYLAAGLEKIGYIRKHSGDFFHEFVTVVPKGAQAALALLAANDILGGLPVEDGILWCATEMNSKQEMDRMLGILADAKKEV